MYAKISIRGEVETLTGLHIGTGGAYAAIGAADSLVIRDTVENMPMIPASSLKGKLRTLLSKTYSPSAKSPEEDADQIKALFGSQEKPGRLIFHDMFLSKDCIKELHQIGIYTTTEIKFENTIGRLTSIATPRQIERVIRGCRFQMQITCDVYDAAEAESEIALLAEGLKLLQYDYLGGNGSRGYGKIAFRKLSADCPVGEIPPESLEKCRQILKGAEYDEIQSM